MTTITKYSLLTALFLSGGLLIAKTYNKSYNRIIDSLVTTKGDTVKVYKDSKGNNYILRNGKKVRVTSNNPNYIKK